MLAIAGTLLALPQLLHAFSWPVTPGFTPPHDQASDMWTTAFVVGTTSFVLALIARRTERLRRSASGRRLARRALVVAIVGACVWALPECVLAGSGL